MSLPDETLKRTHRLMKEIQKVSKVGAWEYDVNSGKMFWTDEIYRIYGVAKTYDPNDINRNVDFYSPPERAKISSAFRNTIEKGAPYDLELQMVTAKGKKIWVRTIAKAEKKKGKITRVFGNIMDITQNKETEKRLQESEEKYRMIAETSNDWVYLIAPNGNAGFISPSCERLTGYSPQEFTNNPGLIREIIHHDDKEAIEHFTEISDNASDTYNMEFRIISKNGETRWITHSCRPVYNKEGVFSGRRGSNRDITQRKKAEEALIHSHDLMRYIVEHDTSAIAIHDSDLNYIYVSKRYLQEYRVREEDIIGKHHYEVFPDIPPKWKEVHKRALAGEVLRSEEDLFERQDGSKDWTRWVCRPWYDVNGSVGGIILYTEVINDRKRKEIEIKTLNGRLELLTESVKKLASSRSIEAIQQVVTSSARQLVNADGATIVFRDNEYCYYAAEDAISQLWQGRKFLMSECIGGWVMQNSKPAIIVDVYQDDRIDKDFYRTTFVKSLTMVPVNTDEPLATIGSYWKTNYAPTEIEVRLLQTLADATAISVENVNLQTDLEKRVKERTAQLDSVNSELRTFTYSVSHDLKAPLRGIDGYSKLLLDNYGSSLDDEARFFIETIRSSTIQMNQLIDDLLEYSRLEVTQSTREKINLLTLVESVLSVYGDDLESKGFTIKTRIPDVEIMADQRGLTLVLRNLIDNAIKFSARKPEPVITITAEKNESSWEICVIDNGIGFDIKFRDKIFEIFQRLHRPEDYPGTGIGLAMVKKAMKKMGGKVRAESTPDSGSAFFIEIPI